MFDICVFFFSVGKGRIDSCEDVVVGVNKYRQEEESPIDVLRIDNKHVLKQQVERLNRCISTSV